MKKITLLSLVTSVAIFANALNFKDIKDDGIRANPLDFGGTILSFHSSISEAKKSVVNISTTKTIKSSNLGQFPDIFNDPFFKDFFNFNFQMPENQTRKSTSLGSGVIIEKNGYIVTNYHVIEDADEIIVNLLDNNKVFKAKVIGSDPKTDLAIIKIDGQNLNAITFTDSSKILEGDVVFAIGNPFGVGGSISQGIVSALNKDNIGINQYENFIQTDASINPGNSGGALVDSRGALIGINSAILSRSGGNNGIGFAIPSNMVKEIAQKLIKDGKITRGYIGVSIANLTDDQKEIYKSKEGALVSQVEKGKPADKAGLKRGDLIIKVDDKNIKDANDLKNLIGSLSPNKEIRLTFERSGEIKHTNITLIDMEHKTSNTFDATIDGLKVANLTPELRKKFRITQEQNGIIITEVKENSSAFNGGFEIGDLILQVNETIINNVKDFIKELEENKKIGKKPLVWVNRNGAISGLVLK